MDRFLSTHGETLLAERYGAAIYARLGALGFFSALMSFMGFPDLRERLRRMREEQRAQGLDS